MKKFKYLLIIFIVALVAIFSASLIACGEEAVNGINGIDGMDGQDGKDGINGKDGQDGKDGINGIDGQDGKDGINGIDGKDGVGIKSTEINTLGELIVSYTDGTTANLGKIVPHGHEIIEEEYIEIEATCEHTGMKYIVCKTCKSLIRTEVTPKENHSFTDEVFDATCSQDGYTKHTCQNCGYAYMSDKVSHTEVEHEYESTYSYDENHHWKKAICEHSDVYLNETHSYNENGICIYCGYVGNAEDYIVYKKIDGKDEYAVDDFTSDDATILYIPGEYKGLPVTAINDCAFYGRTNLKKLVIEENVLTIGLDAFKNCTSLVSVTLPCSLKDISLGAFSMCVNIEDVTAPIWGVNHLPNKSFTNLWLFGEGELGSNAFRDCTKLKNINFAEESNLQAIGTYAFYDCTSLTHIDIPNSVKNIGERAFWGCTGLTTITIPVGVTVIESYMFHGCSSLSVVTIPKTISVIEMSAFYDCSSLQGVYISDMAMWCNIDFQDEYSNPLFYAHNLFLNNTLQTELIIPENVQSIGDWAFQNCCSIERVLIPSTVVSLGCDCFKGVKCIERGKGILYVDKWVVGCDTSLQYAIIRENTVGLADSAFFGCNNLKSITIPECVTSIGVGIISYCDSLESITVEEGNSAYYSSGNCLIETASKTLIAGCNRSIIPGSNSVTTIGKYAFRGCRNLISITIPTGVTSIGDYAFDGCENLTNLTFENTNNWYKIKNNETDAYINWQNKTGGMAVNSSNLSNHITGSYFSKDTGCYYYWYKLEN